MLEHHEHVDGSGYPGGLAGDEITLEARILHAVDAFAAMTADRPYRDAMSTTEALAELRLHSGTQFDPEVVAAVEREVGAVAHSSQKSSTISVSPLGSSIRREQITNSAS